jgi:hypothetical protein
VAIRLARSALAALLVLCGTNVLAERLIFKGYVAQANWIEQTGCIERIVFIAGSEWVTREIGGESVPQANNMVASVTEFDLCAGTFTTGDVEGRADFTMPNLNEARLHGTLVGQDRNTGQPIEALVDVTFVGVGALMQSHTLIFHTAGHHFTQRIRGGGQFREASATGTLKWNGVDAISSPASEALMSRYQEMTYNRTEVTR